MNKSKTLCSIRLNLLLGAGVDIMKAELMPLDGKYYGTEIKLTFDDGHEETIKLWDSGSFVPSDRELNEWGYTREQWDNNEEVNDGWGGTMRIRSADITCDGHFESRETLARAQEIVRLLSA